MDLLDAARGVVAGLVAAAADHRDFFFERGQPIGQVESGAGRFLGEAGDFLLQGCEFPSPILSPTWGGVCRGAGGGDCGADQSAHAVDRQWARETLAEPLGHARQAHSVLIAELFETSQVGVGGFGGSLGQCLLPELGGSGPIVAHENFMGHHDGPQIPGNAVVSGAEAEEIDKRVEQLAMVGVGGGCVVIAVFAVVLDDRFECDREPFGGLITWDAFVQIGNEVDFLRVGVLFQIRQPGDRPLVQDRRKFPRLRNFCVNKSAPYRSMNARKAFQSSSGVRRSTTLRRNVLL